MESRPSEGQLREAVGALALALRLQGQAVDAGALEAEALGSAAGLELTLVRLARAAGCRVQVQTLPWSRLVRGPLPVLAFLHDGRVAVVAKATADSVLVQAPGDAKPSVLARGPFADLWTGRVLRLTPRGAVADGAVGADPVRGVLTKYRRVFAEILVLALFIQLFALVTPIFFQVVVDKVLVHRGLSTLDVLAIGLLAVTLFEAGFTWVRAYLHAHSSARVEVELGARALRHLLALPLAWFESRRSGDVLARLREADSLRGFLTGTAPQSLVDLVFSGVFLAVMYWLSPTLTAVVLVMLPVLFAASFLTSGPLRRRLEARHALSAESQGLLGEVVRGAATVKAAAAEAPLRWRFENLLADQARLGFATAQLSAGSGAVGALATKLGTVAILWLGARLVIDGQLTVGQLVAFNMLTARVTQPAARLAQAWQEVQQARLALARLRELFAVPAERGAAATRSVLPRLAGSVELAGVTFRYGPDAAPVLKDVSLQVPAGQMVGITGPSGSGKSSLAKLVQRLYVPEAGRVVVDGVDLAGVNVPWLRRQVGVVPQELMLFAGTVRANITLSDPALPMERVVAAARLAGVHEVILQLPAGYDTQVGEGGAGLSGGQRQRLAIARALVTDPRLLILDEATSALDEDAERELLARLRWALRDRTLLVVTHRPGALTMADRLLRLEAGRLVADEALTPDTAEADAQALLSQGAAE